MKSDFASAPISWRRAIAPRRIRALPRTVLAPLGYRFYHQTAEGPLERKEILGHTEWLNYRFTVIPPERLAALAREVLRAA
jgi:hypothetical protein